MIKMDFVSFSGIRPVETHPHAQFVLPLEGGLDFEAGGVSCHLDATRAAYVPPGVLHSQDARGRNRFLVLNCDKPELDALAAEQFAEQVFLPISGATRQLLSFADAAHNEHIPLEQLSSHWVELLVNAFAATGFSGTDSRLRKLAQAVNVSLERPWSVQDMASQACLSPSRLHAVFQAHLGMTPQEWLTQMRLKKARHLLEYTDITIAEIALRVGYADQSALTRMMHRVTGMTPHAYRVQQRRKP